jgi:hypothetical protein
VLMLGYTACKQSWLKMKLMLGQRGNNLQYSLGM